MSQTIVTPEYGVAAWTGVVWQSGSNFTTTSTSLVDVTGLITPTLANSTTYEIEVEGSAQSSSAAGLKFGIHGGGSGSAATCFCVGQSAAVVFSLPAIDTANNNALLTGTTQQVIRVRGFVTTRSTGTATISFQVQKQTSGTATVFQRTQLKWRAI